MANVSFHLGTSTPGTSGLTAGGIYVNSNSGNMWYATTTARKVEIGTPFRTVTQEQICNTTDGSTITNVYTYVYVNLDNDAITVNGFVLKCSVAFMCSTNGTSWSPCSMTSSGLTVTRNVTKNPVTTNISCSPQYKGSSFSSSYPYVKVSYTYTYVPVE